MKKTPIQFFDLVKEIFKKTFTLSGRESKETFLFYILFIIFTENLILIFSALLNIKLGYQLILSLLLILPVFSLFVRRLHDHNKNMGFALSPFVLFLILLPFINFKAINKTTPLQEKLIAGGIFIEIIAVLFIVQSFLFIIYLFFKGNKNENSYGKPVDYQVNFPKNKKFALFSGFIVCSIIFLLFIFIDKKEVNIIKTEPKQIIQHQLSQQTPLAKKEENKVIFRKIYPLPQQTLQKTEEYTLPQETRLDETTVQKDFQINDILNFLFNISLKSLKEDKEISFLNTPTPKDIIFIKAINGDVLFIVKNKTILTEIKKQAIDCKKEICIFRHNEYLNNISKGS